MKCRVQSTVFVIAVSVGTLGVFAWAAHADLGDELFKLLPDDGAANDGFGISVEISGDTAIVGAWMTDDLGTNAGSAYTFDIATGQQIIEILPIDGAAGDFFGVDVALSGATAIFGACNDDDNGTDSGSAYLFDATTGLQLFKLLPNDGAEGDQFGISVAISGATAIVGAYANEDSGDWTGSAYLFDTTTGVQIAKLLADDGPSTTPVPSRSHLAPHRTHPGRPRYASYESSAIERTASRRAVFEPAQSQGVRSKPDQLTPSAKCRI